MSKKRIRILCLLLATVFLLAACGKGGSPGETAQLPWDPQEPGQELLGAWQNTGENDGFIYIFKDGKWIACDAQWIESASAEYRVETDEKGTKLVVGLMTAKYSVSDDILVLEDTQEPYQRFTLKRVEEKAPLKNQNESGIGPSNWDLLKAESEQISGENYVGCLQSLEGRVLIPEENVKRVNASQNFVHQAVVQYFQVPEKEGRYSKPACCAALAEERFWKNSSRYDIPKGAAVYFTGTHESCPVCGREDAGHVGIYIGGDKVIHRSAAYVKGVRTENVIRVDSIDVILSWGYRYDGWGWQADYVIQEGNRAADWKPTAYLSKETRPDEIEANQSFDLKGTLSVDTGEIISVYGVVCDEKGEQVLPEKDYEPIKVTDEKTRELQNTIDSKLHFGALKPGRYRYIVKVIAINASAANAGEDVNTGFAGMGKNMDINQTVLDVPFSVVAKDAPKLEGLKAVREGEHSARISWNACSGAVEYEVQYYSETRDEWVPDGSYESGTEYVSTGLQKHDAWQFRVRAVLENGGVTYWATTEYSVKAAPNA